jgi:hypothetical protein
MLSNLGSMLLCIYQWWINNWCQKWIDFVKIKFHSNDNIEWPCVQIELNSNQFIEFDLTIELWLKFNWKKIEMQIGEEGIETLLMSAMFPKEINK